MVEATRKVSHVRMSRALHGVLIVSLLAAIGVRAYQYFAATEAQTRSARESLDTNDSRQWREVAGKAFATEDWTLAAEACEKIVDEEPDNVQAWARLAYAWQMLGRYDQAIAAYLRVCQSEGRPRQWALCKIAATYALKNEKRMALDYLQEAVEAGFRQRADEKPVAEDPDFRLIADDPEFQRLAEMTKPISQRNAYRRFDFILGEWNLTGGDGRRIGSAEFTATSGGYAIVGQCMDNARATKSTVLAYYEPTAAQWKQVWLDDQGTVTHLLGQTSDGESIVLEGETTMSDGRRLVARAIFDEDPDGDVHLSLMSSSDAGDHWSDTLDADLVPKEAKPPRASSRSGSPRR